MNSEILNEILDIKISSLFWIKIGDENKLKKGDSEGWKKFFSTPFYKRLIQFLKNKKISTSKELLLKLKNIVGENFFKYTTHTIHKRFKGKDTILKNFISENISPEAALIEQIKKLTGNLAILGNVFLEKEEIENSYFLNDIFQKKHFLGKNCIIEFDSKFKRLIIQNIKKEDWFIELKHRAKEHSKDNYITIASENTLKILLKDLECLNKISSFNFNPNLNIISFFSGINYNSPKDKKVSGKKTLIYTSKNWFNQDLIEITKKIQKDKILEIVKHKGFLKNNISQISFLKILEILEIQKLKVNGELFEQVYFSPTGSNNKILNYCSKKRVSLGKIEINSINFIK